MADTTISIGLDPNEPIAALKSLAEEVKRLQAAFDESLGKKASASVAQLKDNAEKGTNQITKFFQNMGNRVREDLKTAFDVTSILAGANMARQIGEGVKSVLDMERAFDRLNVRMGLSGRAMEDFKRSAGRATAEAGVNIKDIQGGLLSAASRGNVKDPTQMTMIAGALAQAKQINPELDTANAMDDVAEILKRQHLDINGANVRSTLDAINAATVQGGFKNSGEAAQQLAQMSGSAAGLGLDVRQMAGLAAVASKSGDTGESILRQILDKGMQEDRGQAFNAQVGANVFVNGKLNAAALGQIDTKQFGNISPKVLENITGVSGASGQDFVQFIETMRTNQPAFQKVIDGSNETAEQFGVATNNIASKIDMFKARVTNAGAEIGNSVFEMVNGVVNQDVNNKGASHLAGTLAKSGGDLALAGGLSIGAALLTGNGIRGLIGSKIADAEGIQKVYVTNAGEIKGEGGLVGKAFNAVKNVKEWATLTSLGIGTGGIAGAAAMGIGGLSAAGFAGYEFGKHVINPLLGINGDFGGQAYDAVFGDPTQTQMSPEVMQNAITAGMLNAYMQQNANRPKYVTNPSAAPLRGN